MWIHCLIAVMSCEKHSGNVAVISGAGSQIRQGEGSVVGKTGYQSSVPERKYPCDPGILYKKAFQDRTRAALSSEAVPAISVL